MRKILLGCLILLNTGLFCFAQEAVPFDEALQDTLHYLSAKIPDNSTVVALNVQSDSPDLAEYVIDEIHAYTVDTDLFTMVDPQHLAPPLSGELSDEMVQTIGEKLGAQTILSVTISYTDSFYRLRVQAIDVQSAKIQGSRTVTIVPNQLLDSLTGKSHNTATPGELKLLYLGVRGGLSTHFYTLDKSYWGDGREASVSWSGDFAAQLSYQFFTHFALQTEAVFMGDMLVTKNGTLASFSNATVMLPLLAKFTFYPRLFSFSVFGGAYCSIPLQAMTFRIADSDYEYNYSAPFGLILGGTMGIKLGPGTLFGDIRFATDLQATGLSGPWGDLDVYKRNMLFYSLGYELGFIKRGRK
ncbi:outer membrane beta-barrel protein [Treponema primitia]|nr:outer membrane beta-barrel protein [Treponema primitia]